MHSWHTDFSVYTGMGEDQTTIFRGSEVPAQPEERFLPRLGGTAVLGLGSRLRTGLSLVSRSIRTSARHPGLTALAVFALALAFGAKSPVLRLSNELKQQSLVGGEPALLPSTHQGDDGARPHSSIGEQRETTPKPRPDSRRAVKCTFSSLGGRNNQPAKSKHSWALTRCVVVQSQRTQPHSTAISKPFAAIKLSDLEITTIRDTAGVLSRIDLSFPQNRAAVIELSRSHAECSLCQP